MPLYPTLHHPCARGSHPQKALLSFFGCYPVVRVSTSKQHSQLPVPHTLPLRSTPFLSIHFHLLTKLACTPFSIYTYPRKSAELTSNAHPGDVMPIFTLQNARVLAPPAFGPSEAEKLSKMMVKAELSEASITLASPGLHPLPSRSTSRVVRETLPLGGRTGAAARDTACGMAATTAAYRTRNNTRRSDDMVW